MASVPEQQESPDWLSGSTGSPSGEAAEYTWVLRRLRVLGRGSYGVASLVEVESELPVWFPQQLRGPHGQRQRLVVKEVNLGHCPPSTLEDILREIRILKSVSHPNVVQYIDSSLDADTNTMYILMEFCDGGDVAALIDAAMRRQPTKGVTEAEVWALLIQLLVALKFLHVEHRIIHRDLKPQNIFLASNGVVKVGDFGVSAVLSQTVDFARTFVGSPHYLAPEVCEEKPYNGKVDLWALGCVLYEVMAYGEKAFAGTSLLGILGSIINGQFAPIDSVVDKLDAGGSPLQGAPRTAYGPELRRIVTLLIDVEPDHRPAAARLLRLPMVRNHAVRLLPNCLLESRFYCESLPEGPGSPLMTRRRGFDEPTPLAFGATEKWAEQVASAPGSPALGTALVRRQRSGVEKKMSALQLDRTGTNHKLKAVMEAKRVARTALPPGDDAASPGSEEKSPTLTTANRINSLASNTGRRERHVVLFPEDSPMIPTHGFADVCEASDRSDGAASRTSRSTESAHLRTSHHAHFAKQIEVLDADDDDGDAVNSGDDVGDAHAMPPVAGGRIDDADIEEVYSDDFDEESEAVEEEEAAYRTWSFPRVNLDGFVLDNGSLAATVKVRSTTVALRETRTASGSGSSLTSRHTSSRSAPVDT